LGIEMTLFLGKDLNEIALYRMIVAENNAYLLY
jgi:hypothetical protein